MGPRDLVILTLAAALAAALAYALLLRRQVGRVTQQLQQAVADGTSSAITVQLVSAPLGRLVSALNATLHHTRLVTARSRRQEAELRRLIADISHDLRTPITAVRGYQQTLATLSLTPEQRSTLAVAQRNTDELGRLVDRLFEYTSLLHDDREAEPEQVDLTGLVTELLLDAVDPLQAAGLEVDFDPATPVRLCTDRARLSRIVRNLVRNAAQHGRGVLTVRVLPDLLDGRPGASVELVNQVDGEVDVTRLFDRFYTGDGSRSGRTSGLGLAIVARLAEQLGGTASAEQTGRDLAIRVRLPGLPIGPHRGDVRSPHDEEAS